MDHPENIALAKKKVEGGRQALLDAEDDLDHAEFIAFQSCTQLRIEQEEIDEPGEPFPTVFILEYWEEGGIEKEVKIKEYKNRMSEDVLRRRVDKLWGKIQFDSIVWPDNETEESCDRYR